MNKNLKILLAVIIVFALISPLFANRLMYETSTGTVYDFDIDVPSDNERNPIVAPGDIASYGGTAEYFDYDGFVGRLLYEGEPGTIAVSSVGAVATGTPSPRRFYYTGIESGGAVPGIWREVFFVARVKARRHDNTLYNHNNDKNFVIEKPGDTFTVPGAGPELANPGEIAFNIVGNQGTYNIATGYIYKYQYKHVWIDFTVIRTSNDRGFSWWEKFFFSKTERKYYQLQLKLSGISGVDQLLSLEARYNPRSNDFDPGSFVVSLERTAPDLIPFQDLITKNSLNNTYKVGTIRLNANDRSSGSQTPFSVGFYADAAASSLNFNFSRVGGTGPSIPYHVAFNPIISGNTTTITKVTSANNSFETRGNVTVAPIIGGPSYTEHVLLGDIHIYVDTGLTYSTYPISTYSSTIYAIVSTN